MEKGFTAVLKASPVLEDLVSPMLKEVPGGAGGRAKTGRTAENPIFFIVFPRKLIDFDEKSWTWQGFLAHAASPRHVERTVH